MRTSVHPRGDTPNVQEDLVSDWLSRAGQSAEAGSRARPVPTDEPIRVLLVDEQSIVRLGLTSLFATARSYAVVGEASTADDALAGVRKHLPAGVVLDAGF